MQHTTETPGSDRPVNEQHRIGARDFYTDFVLPALAEHLDSAFPNSAGDETNVAGSQRTKRRPTAPSVSAPTASSHTDRRRAASSSTVASRCSGRRMSAAGGGRRGPESTAPAMRTAARPGAAP